MEYFNFPRLKAFRSGKNKHCLASTPTNQQQNNMKIRKDTTHPLRNIELTCLSIQAVWEEPFVL